MKSLIDRIDVRAGTKGSSLLRYLVVGGWSYAVVTATTWGLHEGASLSEELSFASGITLSLIINIFLLKTFVFKSEKSYWGTGIRFVVISAFTRVFEFLLFWVLFRFGVYYLIASTIAMLLGASTKYMVLKRFVYN